MTHHDPNLDKPRSDVNNPPQDLPGDEEAPDIKIASDDDAQLDLLTDADFGAKPDDEGIQETPQ